LKFILYLAFTGWLLSLIIHLLSINHMDVQEKYPWVWVLHIGIFFVWIPAIRELRRYQAIQGKRRIFDIYRLILLNTPNWLTYIAVGSFIYTVINSFIYILTPHSSPGIINGEWVLHNHGHIVKIITENEYHSEEASVMRFYSGGWLGFYGLAMAILYPFTKGGFAKPGPDQPA
jgi:hypothetical protein